MKHQMKRPKLKKPKWQQIVYKCLKCGVLKVQNYLFTHPIIAVPVRKYCKECGRNNR